MDFRLRRIFGCDFSIAQLRASTDARAARADFGAAWRDAGGAPYHNAGRSRPLAEVAAELADAAALTSAEWQTRPLLLNPPALAPLALALIAEIQGRCGYFPPILNIRPIPEALPPRYEVAELVDLQAQRDTARNRR